MVTGSAASDNCQAAAVQASSVIPAVAAPALHAGLVSMSALCAVVLHKQARAQGSLRCKPA